MPTFSEIITDKVFTQAASLGELERNTVRSVLEPALRDARKEMRQLLLREWDNLSFSRRERIRGLINTLGSMLDQLFTNPVSTNMDSMLQDLSRGTFSQAASEINLALKIPLASTTAPPRFYANVANRALIEGNFLFNYDLSDGSPGWWKSLSNRTKEKMGHEIRKSLVIGETPAQASARLFGMTYQMSDGVFAVTRREAEAITRTAIHSVTNATRSQFYEENSDIISAVESLATLDSRTTILCRAHDGLRWSIPDYNPIGHNKKHIPPPRHWRCRSVMIPIMSDIEAIDAKAREMGLEITPMIRASRDGPVPIVKGRGSMDGWMKRKSVNQQNQMLGVGRAELWRNGKVTLQSLVNQRGQLIPLDKLKQQALNRAS